MFSPGCAAWGELLHISGLYYPICRVGQFPSMVLVEYTGAEVVWQLSKIAESGQVSGLQSALGACSESAQPARVTTELHEERP